MPYKNIEDERKYQREHYQRNRLLYLKRARENNKKYYLRNKKFIKRVKSIFGCSRCGYKEHPDALDFHHPNKDKEKSLASYAKDGVSLEFIKNEIRKCVLLCANCHRVEHSKSRCEGN